jgi:hypothetical protein
MDMNKICSLFLLVFFTVIFSGCAFDVVKTNQMPVQYKDASKKQSAFELTDDVNITLNTGYRRKLNKGTKWHYINTISKGDIFKTNDQIFTIEGSNIFEAFIVVSDKQLVGFFLPVEETFSPLSNPKPLPISKIDQ